MNRLGHGKGYYDNFISRYQKTFAGHGLAKRNPYLSTCFCSGFIRFIGPSDMLAVGLALEDQVLPSDYRLPVEPWDHPVDTVIHGSHLLSPQSSVPDASR